MKEGGGEGGREGGEGKDERNEGEEEVQIKVGGEIALYFVL